VCEQSLYNLIDRTVELEVIPACRAYGLGFIPWSPLKGGLLGGLKKHEEGRRTTELVQRNLKKHGERLARFDALCAESGEQPADVAIAWLLRNPVVTAPIIGPRTIEQLDASLRPLALELDDAFCAKLDELFPGPGGEAPEAYAW
jgi:aryl-alcohol dehydrogenase-like predicted oxidoreductase